MPAIPCNLCRLPQKATLLIYGLDDILNRLDFLLLEQRLATLFADPSRDVIYSDMAAVAVDVDRSLTPRHRSLAVNAPRHHVSIVPYEGGLSKRRTADTSAPFGGHACSPALPAGTPNAINAFFATNLGYANLFRFRTEDGVVEHCCALEDSCHAIGEKREMPGAFGLMIDDLGRMPASAGMTKFVSAFLPLHLRFPSPWPP